MPRYTFFTHAFVCQPFFHCHYLWFLFYLFHEEKIIVAVVILDMAVIMNEILFCYMTDC